MLTNDASLTFADMKDGGERLYLRFLCSAAFNRFICGVGVFSDALEL